jgi:hypothetical protein
MPTTTAMTNNLESALINLVLQGSITHPYSYGPITHIGLGNRVLHRY